MAETKIDETGHEAIEDPSGLALQCSCGTWAMLYRNSLGLNAGYEHAMHAYRATDVAAAESRARAAGYAEAVQALRDDEAYRDWREAVLRRGEAVAFAGSSQRDGLALYLAASAPSATTEEPTP